MNVNWENDMSQRFRRTLGNTPGFTSSTKLGVNSKPKRQTYITELVPVFPRNPRDTPKKICLMISLCEDGCAANQFAANTVFPLSSHRTIAVIATTDIVTIWNVIITNANRLDSRIPRRHIPENRTRMKTVNNGSGNGKMTSPARYPPALQAETTAKN